MSAPTPAPALDRSPARAMQQYTEMRALSDADWRWWPSTTLARGGAWPRTTSSGGRRFESGEPLAFDGARKAARAKRLRRAARKRRIEARRRANLPVEVRS